MGVTALSLLGVDTGGTFTDFVYVSDKQIKVHKVLSTPDAPELAILQGIEDLGLSLQDLRMVHGSTVATNAVLQGQGVSTVYITNRGFADVLTIGRQARASLYALQPLMRDAPVPVNYCLETGGRLSANGDVIEPLSDDDIQLLCEQVQALQPQAVAINLLFSYLAPHLEQRIAEAMPASLYVSCSSEVLPEYKEYERGMATWLNAYVGPLMQGYLQRLVQQVSPARVAVMQSSTGTVDASQAGSKAVNLLLSGPAGGLMAAQSVGRQMGCEKLLTFDMGGTSTDVALLNGELTLTSEGRIGDYPVAVPMVDLHTIGAGGGSIAFLDAGGLLHVGPESAGAFPGPVCYGQGGTRVTVTDANLILGRIPADTRMGGYLKLDINLARAAMAVLAEGLQCSVEQAAQGIIRIANEHMARALRVISLQRGCDPREYMLMSFGGAGGLHVCALAEDLQMTRAVVPVHAGVLSALGMLVTPVSRHRSRSLLMDLNKIDSRILNENYQTLIDQGAEELHQEGLALADIVITRSMDLRYLGQSYYLNIEYDPENDDLIDCQQRFSDLHLVTYGHLLHGPVELVNIRVQVRGPRPAVSFQSNRVMSEPIPVQLTRVDGLEQAVPVYNRENMQLNQSISGPALVAESVATTYVAPGWRVYLDDMGNLMLARD